MSAGRSDYHREYYRRTRLRRLWLKKLWRVYGFKAYRVRSNLQGNFWGEIEAVRSSLHERTPRGRKS